MFLTLSSCSVIDIGQSIQLVDNDVNVVATDTVALTSDSFSFISACNGMKLTTADLIFDGIEMCCNRIDTCRIAHEDDFIGQILRLQMQVKARAVVIDNQFRFGKKLVLFHRIII